MNEGLSGIRVAVLDVPRLSSMPDGFVFGRSVFDHGVPLPEPPWRSPTDMLAKSETRWSMPLPRGAAMMIGALPRRGLSTLDLVVEVMG